MKRAIIHAVVYSGKEILSGMAVLVNNGKISALVKEKDVPGDYQLLDINGNNLAPAFIDLQIYGGNEYLFSAHPCWEAIEATRKYCMNGGAAGFLLTMATNSPEVFGQGIDIARKYLDNGGKGLLGLHLEGPWINPLKKGAHLSEFIHQPTVAEAKKLVERAGGIVKMITLAPEIVSDEVIDYLIDQGIVLSAGHSNATYQQAMAAFKKIKVATHLFNAMSPLQGREPGMVGAVYHHPAVNASIVADGVHVHFSSIHLSKKILGDRLFLITDAVAETSRGPYQHIFKKDRYVLPDGTLSGSALTMMQAVKNCVQQAGIPLPEALRMASLYPARILGIENREGLIEKNFSARFAVFDNELNWVDTIDFAG